MTLQNLKDSRTEIIEAITNLELDVKKVMTLMSMEVDFTTSSTWQELLKEVVYMHFTERSKRSGHKLAELVGNNENRTYSILDKKFINN